MNIKKYDRRQEKKEQNKKKENMGVKQEQKKYEGKSKKVRTERRANIRQKKTL